MSVVNEINSHFSGLARDLKTLHTAINKLSVALENKQIAGMPDLSKPASGLLPSIASRQMDLAKVIGVMTNHINELHEVVNPSAAAPTTSPFPPKPKVSEIEQRAVDALAVGLGYEPTKIGGQN